MSNPKMRRLPEAPESNAGDDFHVLWAVRKTLELLDIHNSNLESVTVEGPEFHEGEVIDDTGEKLFSIDTGEYYGGETFETAEKVVFSQLKYSTRRSKETFTLARLSYRDKSILGKLARTFKGYYSEFGRNEVIKKVSLKLVSNRPIEDAFKCSLDNVQTYLLSKPGEVQKHQLKKEFPDLENEFNRIQGCADLKSVELVDFLRVLDFKDCGTEPRFVQKQELIQAIAQYGSYETIDQYNRLYMLVHGKMMPEASAKNAIRIEDVLCAFNMASIDNLYPVPAKLLTPEKVIEREHWMDVRDKIITANQGIICIHGVGGIGKSTFIQSLNNLLPDRSETIIYDCYGQGTYFDESAIRHTYKNAVIQICNDLANVVGTPLLLSHDLNNYDFIAEFKKRIEIASKIIGENSDSAVLTVVIDAADNSVYAAKNKEEDCFVTGILSLSELPENCRIIVTSRSGRLEDLKLPYEVKANAIELEPFSQLETGLLLESRFPLVTPQEIEEFHSLTHRNPRVQYYSLENRKSLDQVFDFLKPYGESVNSLISAQISDAKKNLVEDEKIDNLLSYLIHLPRPVPINVLSKLSGVSSEIITDFCVDLWSGIVITDSIISFRDEDFENYLREEYEPSLELYSTISDSFLGLVEADTYSCEQLGYILYRAEKYELLQQIVLDSDYLEVIIDPVKKREITINRTRYAILSCDNSESIGTFFKLLYLSAEASKSEKARTEIIAENIDLISQFTDLEGVQKLFFEITSNIHYGAANLECASIFSKNEKTILFAKRHLRQAEAWIEMRRNLDDDEVEHYQISAKDIAQGALAVLRIDDYENFENWLRRWKPRKIMIKVIELIVDELLLEDQRLLMSILPKIKRRDVLMITLVKINSFNNSLINIEEYSESIFEFLHGNADFPLEFNLYIISFCEILSMERNHRVKVLQILGGMNAPRIQHAPSFYGMRTINDDPVGKMDLLIRKDLLEANLKGRQFVIDQLIPPAIKKKGKKESDEDYRKEQEKELKDLYSKLLPVYEFKLHLFLDEIKKEDYSKMEDLLKPLTSDYSYRYSRHDINGLDYFVSSRIIEMIHLFPEKTKILEKLIEDLKSNDVLSINAQLLIAEEASKYEETKAEALNILSKVEGQVLNLTLNARDKIDRYISCARLAARIDPKEAEIYFQKAVSASTEIDLDAFDKLRSLHFMTGKLKNERSSLKNQERSFRLARLVEAIYRTMDGYDHFPWDHSILAIQNISIQASLSCRCRWDHLDYIDVFSNWSNLLHEASTNLSIEQLCGLMTNGFFDHEFQDLLLEILDLTQDNLLIQSKIYKAISDELRIYTPLENRGTGVKRTLDLLEKSHLNERIDKSDLQELYNYLNQPKKESGYERGSKKEEVEDRFLIEVLKETDYKSGSSISEGLIRLTKGEQNSRFRVSEYLDLLKVKCQPNEIIIHLDAILNIDSSIISSYELENVLKKRIEEWDSRQVVKEWKKTAFKKTVFKFLTISELDYLPILSLLNLADLFSASKKDLAIALKSYFTDNIDKFSVESIYQSIEILHHLLQEESAKEVLDWAIVRWETIYKNPLNALSFEIYEEELPSIEKSLAYTLRFCLAHPDKRNRWQAVNIIRRLIDFGDETILRLLIELRDEASNECFKYDNYHFFSVSSKLWLFLVLSKLSESHPELIKPHFSVLKDEAEKTSSAHALTRYYAKLACQKIYEFDRELMSESDFEKLNKILAPLDNAEYYTNGNRSYKGKFPFNELETIPYWYDNLGDIFKVGKRAIAELAEHHINSSLNYSGNPHKDEEYSVSSSDYYLTSNRKGTIPTVETNLSYHEYHAMFYVANDLIENHKCDGDHWRGWQDWLNGWLITGEKKWLEDIRQETPRDSIFWNFSREKETSNNWLYSINIDDFRSAIQTKGDDGKEWRVISCSISRHNWKDTETISINSAIVSKKGSKALLHTLQTCDSHYDYKLPELNEYDKYINYNGLNLRGFYIVNSQESKEEEQLNYRVKTLMVVNHSLDVEFIKWIRNDEIFKNESIDSLIRFENWSDVDDKVAHQSGFGSKGYRLLIRQDLIDSYLKQHKEDLILECIINRSPERIKEMKYIDASFKIFVVNEEGITE